MAETRPAGISALRSVVPSVGALVQAGLAISRGRQGGRSLGIASLGGSMGLRQAQGSFGSKSGTRQQHGEQDTEHKAHDVSPSQLSGNIWRGEH
jgi:hypothetical protein